MLCCAHIRRNNGCCTFGGSSLKGRCVRQGVRVCKYVCARWEAAHSPRSCRGGQCEEGTGLLAKVQYCVLLLGAFCRCAKAIAQVVLLWWLLLLWVAAARTGTCASEDTTL